MLHVFLFFPIAQHTAPLLTFWRYKAFRFVRRRTHAAFLGGTSGGKRADRCRLPGAVGLFHATAAKFRFLASAYVAEADVFASGFLLAPLALVASRPSTGQLPQGCGTRTWRTSLVAVLLSPAPNFVFDREARLGILRVARIQREGVRLERYEKVRARLQEPDDKQFRESFHA